MSVRSLSKLWPLCSAFGIVYALIAERHHPLALAGVALALLPVLAFVIWAARTPNWHRRANSTVLALAMTPGLALLFALGVGQLDTPGGIAFAVLGAGLYAFLLYGATRLDRLARDGYAEGAGSDADNSV